MNKDKINQLFRKFGFELHGLGYLEKLRNSSVDKNEWEKMKELVGTNARIIFDVGASDGATAANYFRHFPQSSIHSFEPFPGAWVAFEDLHRTNPNIVLNKYALSSRIGMKTFNVNRQIDTSSFLESKKIGTASDKTCETVSQIDVSTNTLDKYCLENQISNIDILKIDVQGFEVEVLKGAINLLERGAIKVIFVEMFFEAQYIDQALFFDIASFLYKYDFVVHDFYDPYYSKSNLVWCDAIFIHKKK